jgi:hypothetical protein
MARSTITLAAMLICCFLRGSASAEVTNSLVSFPPTKLESFATNNSTLILKSSADIGSISGNAGVVSLRCREITDLASGHKEQGVAVGIAEKGPATGTLLIDYDELPALINAMEYLGNVQVSVTSLDTFDAEYITKGGFRIEVFGNRLTGRLQYGVRDARNNLAPVVFSSTDMARLRSLFALAKAKLDSLNG